MDPTSQSVSDAFRSQMRAVLEEPLTPANARRIGLLSKAAHDAMIAVETAVSPDAVPTSVNGPNWGNQIPSPFGTTTPTIYSGSVPTESFGAQLGTELSKMMARLDPNQRSKTRDMRELTSAMAEAKEAKLDDVYQVLKREFDALTIPKVEVSPVSPEVSP